MTSFTLDQILEKDTFPLSDLKLCTLRLMNDQRYPWFILVPAKSGLVEIIDLTTEDQLQLMREIASVSQIMKNIFNPLKLNVAALGNQVRQLHIHLIARDENDPAWPGPVWGVGNARPYSESVRLDIVSKWKQQQ